jgi:hypothetical protein
VDVYEREAEALIVPDMSRREVIAAVQKRMALEVDTAAASQIVFRIEHSTIYRSLVVDLVSGHVAGYRLTNGSEGDET